MKNYEDNYWAQRSKGYNRTNWVTNSSLMDAYLSMLPTYDGIENVLEVGIGTGVVASRMLKKVVKVEGIDKSEDMVKSITNPQIHAIIGDAHVLPYKDNHFDLIYMRNVLHYLDNPVVAFKEIRRCLKPHGYFLFSQVVPPEDFITEEYDFLIGRNIHYPTQEEITGWMKDLHIKATDHYILSSQSILNWLNNTCNNEKEKEEIINRHHETSDLYKSLVNFSASNNDIFVDVKHFMILAVK